MPGMPGHITESTSKFDGRKTLAMEPAWLYNTTSLKLGLYKDSTLPKDKVILTAVAVGAHAISPGKSLKFNIDNETVALKTHQQLTHIKTTAGTHGYVRSHEGAHARSYNASSKDYLVDITFIKRILKAENVAVRLDFRNSYAEGIFSHDGISLARPAFNNFMKKL